MILTKFSKIYLAILLVATSFSAKAITKLSMEHSKIPTQSSLSQARYKFKQWKSFIKQIATSFGIHYADQSGSNLLYHLCPNIYESNISLLISLAQTSISIEASDACNEIIAAQDGVENFYWAHFWGWVLATSARKPMDIVFGPLYPRHPFGIYYEYSRRN